MLEALVLQNILAEHAQLMQILVQAVDRFGRNSSLEACSCHVRSCRGLFKEAQGYHLGAGRSTPRQQKIATASRIYLVEWLSDRDVQQYDMVYRPQHWCKCED